MLATAKVVSLPLRTRFRGVDHREALLFEGPQGWAEWSPFLEYADAEAAGMARLIAEVRRHRAAPRLELSAIERDTLKRIRMFFADEVAARWSDHAVALLDKLLAAAGKVE